MSGDRQTVPEKAEPAPLLKNDEIDYPFPDLLEDPKPWTPEQLKEIEEFKARHGPVWTLQADKILVPRML
jgi:hypothetical protein